MGERAQHSDDRSGAQERFLLRTVLTATAPYTLSHTLERLRHFRASPGDREVGAGGATLTLASGKRALLVRIGDAGSSRAPETEAGGEPSSGWGGDDRQDGSSSAGAGPTPLSGTDASHRPARLHVALKADAPLSDAQRDAALLRLRRHLGLDDDVAGLTARGADDPAFAPVLAALRGFHMVRHTTPFEAAVWALVQQRTPNAFAYATVRRLAELLGPTVERSGRRWIAFPESAALLHGAHGALLEATNNTRKVERLLPLAEAFATVDDGWLHAAPYDEVRGWLERIHGVGRWTSEYVLLRGLGRFERTPWSDTGLLPAISRVYTGGFAIARGDARALAERYGWLQGLWAHYLKVAAFGAGSNY